MNEVMASKLAQEAGLVITEEQYTKIAPAIFYGESGKKPKEFSGIEADYAVLDDLVVVGNKIHEAFAAKQPKPFPHMGDTVTIKHQVKRSSNGDVLGVQRADGKGYQATITAVYLDGRVRTGVSDVWDVKPGSDRQWETVNPMHLERN